MSLGFDAAVVADLQAAPAGMAGETAAKQEALARPIGDAACQVARRRVAPFLWPDLQLGADAITSFQLLQLTVAGLDPACVGTIPIHGPGGGIACLHVAALCSPEEFARLFHERASALQAAAIAAAQRLIELGIDETIGTRLTDRQLDVLHWVVQGKTNWEIGQILGISPDTVRQHVMHIAGALNVRNRVQVAAAAVARGICVPQLGGLIEATQPN
jgi:DNA-binding CsgD family transcriptional regulator